MNETKSNTDIHERDSLIVGHITGRVLHEFNNVLQGIIGLAEMLDADPKVPEKAKISVKAIRRLGQNATQMINKLGQEDHVSESGTRNIVAVATAMPTEVPQKTKMSILVAEDDPLVLNVIKGMLRTEPPFSVCIFTISFMIFAARTSKLENGSSSIKSFGLCRRAAMSIVFCLFPWLRVMIMLS